MKPTVTAFALAFSLRLFAAEEHLPKTEPLTMSGDISAQMVSGISRFLDAETERSIERRKSRWHYDFTSIAAYERSIVGNRNHLRTIIGAVDERVPVRDDLQFVSSTQSSAVLAETERFTVYVVRWPVFDDVFAEGLWVKPKGSAIAKVIALPDADQTPEMVMGLAPGIAPESQFARRLAESGCEVIVPTLISREDTFSGNPKINRFTNQPHREWIYRQAFELGRHIIGYEVQEVLAAVDFYSATNSSANIGVIGYGEGGLIAFYAAALDTRIKATVVSGYFDSRQGLATEPIYRNVFGLLEEFGDAEIASLIMPRRLVLEYSPSPEVSGPPSPHDARAGAAPGKISTPDFGVVSNEFNRLAALLGNTNKELLNASFIAHGKPVIPGSPEALVPFLTAFGISSDQLDLSSKGALTTHANASVAERQKRLVTQLTEHTQKIFRESERKREEFFWSRLNYDSLANYESSTKPFREIFRDQVIGRFTNSFLRANAKTRKINQTDTWTAYEVVLDVYPEVFAWGQLLIPFDINGNEKRPVVVCQHGLEGLPQDIVTTDINAEPYRYYQGFASKLADRGFVVFAPHNPYRGGDRFRVLQRKANPLNKSLFSVIAAQHEQILNWLETLPFVDSSRIGFYGLSYGGKSAMRLPALIDRYALSICSGDFNEWVGKNVSVDFRNSYMFTGEYEMPEFNLGSTFNYAEMAALIAPRPFMVERGHSDAVGLDSWVAAEYAKVRKLYDELGIGDRTKIEYFNGPHRINGIESFRFVERLKKD